MTEYDPLAGTVTVPFNTPDCNMDDCLIKLNGKIVKTYRMYLRNDYMNYRRWTFAEGMKHPKLLSRWRKNDKQKALEEFLTKCMEPCDTVFITCGKEQIKLERVVR